jgi:hypothetical protein
MHRKLVVPLKWSVLWRRPTHDSDYMLCIISYMLSSGSLYIGIQEMLLWVVYFYGWGGIFVCVTHTFDTPTHTSPRESLIPFGCT